MHTPNAALQTARSWAQERLRSGAEPPWSYYRLMQLIEAVDALATGADASPLLTGMSDPSSIPASCGDGNILSAGDYGQTLLVGHCNMRGVTPANDQGAA